MSDDPAPVDPLDALEAEATDPLDIEMVQLMRKVVLRENRRRAQETTDEHGSPLPRLTLDGPRPPTDDPLLRVGYAMVEHLPPRWEYAILQIAAAADDVRIGITVKHETGGPLTFRHLLYLPDVAAASAELRRSMYEADGRGTWYGAGITLQQSGAMTTHYDYDNPPFGYWGPNEVTLARRDQELYPRPPERLPDWHPAR